MKKLAVRGIRGDDVVVEKYGLRWERTQCDGECVEAFGCVEGPNGGARFE